jgi:hypothetical protein
LQNLEFQVALLWNWKRLGVHSLSLHHHERSEVMLISDTKSTLEGRKSDKHTVSIFKGEVGLILGVEHDPYIYLCN